MGDLVRFPGTETDWDHLDNFVWTPELLADYAARARTLAARYGSDAPTAERGRWPRGRCQDCRRLAGRRYRVGWRLLCERDAESRLRVRRGLTELDRERVARDQQAIAGEATRSGADASPAEGGEPR